MSLKVEYISIIVLLALYAVVFVVGILSGRIFQNQQKKLKKSSSPACDSSSALDNNVDSTSPVTNHENLHSDENRKQYETGMVADRKIGSVLGWLTMTATLAGGGFLNGTSESVARDGLVWTLAPFGIAMGLIIGGLVYAPAMRRKMYMTMLDPLKLKYGDVATALVCLSALFADILWSGSILAALGTSLQVISGLNMVVSVLVSAVVAVGYTLFGQMISVIYTDVVQLVFLTTSLIIVLPFILTNDDVKPLLISPEILVNRTWTGQVPSNMAGVWADLLIAMTLGTIPWSSYFQRVLSMNSVSSARRLSILAGFSSLVLAVPPVAIGVVASAVDWKSYNISASLYEDTSLALPLVVKTFTPTAVSIIGLCGISAAVMSSCDSSILGSAALFTSHVYTVLRNKCSKSGEISSREQMWCLRLSVIALGVFATLVALLTPSMTVYGLFILAADIVFCSTLPQLTAALFIPFANGYGSIVGFVTSIVLRLLSGEAILNLDVILRWPYYSPASGQLFPFRTFIMLLALLLITAVSYAARLTFRFCDMRYDILGCGAERNFDVPVLELTDMENVPTGKIAPNKA